ncbi:hypothetical protein [Halomicrococcus sp. NG-SE-24]|uniref:hypothetical protein n=1 Tax=Halomicrococcus sp. NG-SE-24 TaxID=3436928 RepID=UPI003D980655
MVASRRTGNALAARGGSARGAGWVSSLGRALARAPGGAHEGASESAQMGLSGVVVEKTAM